MTLFFGFTIGLLVAILVIGRPIKIEIKHTHETITAPITDADLAELEKKMGTPDPAVDQIYADMGETLQEVQDIMKGSDRV